MSFAETMKELVSFILKGVDFLDYASIFLLCTINHHVILIIRILSWFVPTGTSSEFFPPEYPPHRDIPTRSLDIPLGYGLPRKSIILPSRNSYSNLKLFRDDQAMLWRGLGRFFKNEIKSWRRNVYDYVDQAISRFICKYTIWILIQFNDERSTIS